MKILKIFGIVVGIHVFALILIFANPGCSTTSKQPPTPADTVARADAASVPGSPISVPNLAAAGSSQTPITFNPDAPAVAAPSAAGRHTPTRPGTPAASAVAAPPAADLPPATTYTVKSGDNLWSIANKNHLSAAALASANGLKTNAVLRPGQKLIIPGKAGTRSAASTTAAPAPAAKASEAAPAAAAPAAAARANGKEMRHIVKSGESLSEIARTYGVAMRDIAVANNITDPAKIKANSELIIPGWEGASGKAAKSGKKNGSSASKSAPAPASAAETQPVTPSLVEPAQPATPAPAVPLIPIEENPLSGAPKR